MSVASFRSSQEPVRAIGVIGLGAMGLGMASRLMEAGYELHVMGDRAAANVDQLRTLGMVHTHRSLQELTASACHVLTCLPTGEDVLSVVNVLPADGAGIRALIDCSTVGMSAAEDIHQKLKEIGWQYIDAPVTGGPKRAASGELIAYVGADGDPRDGAMEAIRSFCARVVELGSPGTGQLLKLANNSILLGLVALNGYALSFAETAGLNASEFAEIVQGGAADNWQLQNYLPTALASGATAGFALQLAHKDLKLVLDGAHSIGLDLGVLEAVQALYERASAHERKLGQKSDFSAVIRELATDDDREIHERKSNV